MNDNHHDKTPAEAFDRYLAEVDRTTPVRKPPKRWSKSTIILGVIEVGIVAAAVTWWLMR